MFGPELKGVIIEVLSSWQVIAVTIAIILYFSLIKRVMKPKQQSAFLDGDNQSRKRVRESMPEITNDDNLGLEEKESQVIDDDDEFVDEE